MKFLLLFLVFILLQLNVVGQTKTVTIEGYAPGYLGQNVQINEISDYLTMKEEVVANATVKADSTFMVVFKCEETQRINLKIGNNSSFMYVQPDGEYTIYFPLKDKYTPYRPAGNKVELTFLDLDSTDINYKILAFNRWMDNYLALNYKDHLKNPIEFNKNMDSFKLAAQRFYVKDTGTYIYNYVRFSIANLDNIQQLANRNRFEKHDFYLKYQPVLYKNDAYMDYFKNFYKGLMPTIPMEVNNRVYLGLLKNSPTLIMNALGKEYTLINARVRELAMIQLLSDLYYLPDYPQTNILEVLDSVKTNGLFETHRAIAKNTIARLTEVNTGGKAPDFLITTSEGLKNLNNFKGKYLYLHFFNPSSEKNKQEMPVMKHLFEKYGNDIQFLTISKESMVDELGKTALKEIPWEVAVVPDSYATIWENYHIATFPTYILIDPYSYVVQAPALGPLPNNLYETIDKVFFEIQKTIRQLKNQNNSNEK